MRVYRFTFSALLCCPDSWVHYTLRGPDLLGFAGLPPVEVPALPLPVHIAEKVHAYTRLYGEGMRPNTRVKNLVDLALIAGTAVLEADTVRQALDATFATRGTHPLPVTLPPPPVDGARPYAKLAGEIGIDPAIAAGYSLAAAFLDPLLSGAVTTRSRWNPATRMDGCGGGDVNGTERRRLSVDLEDLESAFENGFPDLSYYLDTETGAVAMVGDETRGELEEIYAELGDGDDLDDAAVAEAIRQRNVADWQREALEEADRVERGFGTRYVAVPRDNTDDAYRDMEDFVTSVADERLRERLADAIDGRGAFSRFKRVLSAHDEERERWFAFRDARLRDRIVAWLDEEGIEPSRDE